MFISPTTNTQITPRQTWLDALRILACVMVVFVHAPIPLGAYEITPIKMSYLYFMGPCIGLYMMISGTLLLPIRNSAKEFLKKRLKHVIVPLFFWTILYLLIYQLNGDEVDWLKSIINIPFSPQGNEVFWFLYPLIACYLVMPVVSPWLEKVSKNEAVLYGILILSTFTLSYLGFWLETGYTLKTINANSPLFYFSSYIGYFYFGWFLNKYPGIIKIRNIVVICILCIVWAILTRLSGLRGVLLDGFWYFSIPILSMAVFWFSVAQRLGPWFESLSARVRRALQTVSSLTFGIYLCHMLSYEFLIPQLAPYMPDGYLTKIIISGVITFTVSLLTTWLIAQMPWSKYIIGYTMYQRKAQVATA